MINDIAKSWKNLYRRLKENDCIYKNILRILKTDSSRVFGNFQVGKKGKYGNGIHKSTI